ncbi:AAA family ATPase [Pseudodesulfovibrio sediminis]|uniref:DNA repair protein RecN n=1 Tax=Pseudodesulfovibrio sediminis TaxID=2810563 RepID=A0ABN6EU08_9BACT|nr:AAA family ATPase [Pseudodesulfovibrio sediminis]BCS88922.1 hypothetical protein PSDVSF_21640 [Pseudodesulfovibrio sediminis]
MINKIVIDNFMAHEHTEFELGAGVTILTGPNNTGKSAVVEALRCLATNPTPKHYIRHGAKEARVTVELDDGSTVAWIRKKRSSGYELWRPGDAEPQAYWKFGRRPPEDIREVLKLDMVELETGNEVDIHVGNQREPVFLLNQPPSNAAAFFAASTESAHLLAMQNLLKRQTQDAKRRERELLDDVRRIEGEIDQLAALPDVGLQLENAQTLELESTRLEQAIPGLESILEAQQTLTAAIQSKRMTVTLLNDLNAPPVPQDVEKLNGHISTLRSVDRKARFTDAVVASLAPLSPPPEVEDTRSLAQVAEQLCSGGAALERAVAKKATLHTLKDFPEPDQTEPLAGCIDAMITLSYRRNRLARYDDALQAMEPPPSIEPGDGLLALVAELEELENRRIGRQKALDDLEIQLQSVVEAMDARVTELGCCPTCGGDLTTESFIDQGCRHDS